MIDTLLEVIKTKKNIWVEIVSIFKTGSSLFCTNCKDIDYVVVVKSSVPIYLKYTDKECDYFIYSEDERKKRLNFVGNKVDTLFILDELFKKDNCIYGDSSTNFDLLANKEKYIDMLREVVPMYLINPNKTWHNSNNYCHRHLWWAILGLKFIENNHMKITEDIKEIIQKCHDGILEKSWEDWVKKKLLN